MVVLRVKGISDERGNEVQFQEINQPKTKATYVAEQIVEVLKTGKYKVGDHLPSERDIAGQMKVSRNSVREALSALQIIGVIESRSREGIYIRLFALDHLNIGKALHLVKASEDLLEMWEARREIETSIVKLAISRASSKELNKINNILEQMREATYAKDTVGYLSSNTQFHLAIAEAADNLALQEALNALMGITTQQLLEDVNIGYVLESIDKSFKEHQAIFNAIKMCIEEAGAQAIRVHFEELEKYFRNECPRHRDRQR